MPKVKSPESLEALYKRGREEKISKLQKGHLKQVDTQP